MSEMICFEYVIENSDLFVMVFFISNIFINTIIKWRGKVYGTMKKY